MRYAMRKEGKCKCEYQLCTAFRSKPNKLWRNERVKYNFFWQQRLWEHTQLMYTCTSTQTMNGALFPSIALILSVSVSERGRKFRTNTNLSENRIVFCFHPGLLILLDSQMLLFQHSPLAYSSTAAIRMVFTPLLCHVCYVLDPPCTFCVYLLDFCFVPGFRRPHLVSTYPNGFVRYVF